MASDLLGENGLGPLYRQAADYLRKRLMDGTYPPLSTLPSEMDLVTLLGVSRPTVRRALQLMIDEGLIERVPGRGTFVAERPSAPKRTGNVGLVVLEMRDHFLMRIVNGAERALAERGFRPVLCNSGNEIGVEQAKLRDMWDGGGVDGLLIMPADSPQAHRTLVEFVATRVPLVLIDRFFEGLEAPFVASDDVRGGYLVTQHLLSLGHRRIGFVTRPNLYVTSVARRLAGYRQALEESGVAFDASLIFQGLLPYLSETHHQEQESGRLAQYERAALRDYLAQPDRPTAIFACNDFVALRTMEACREMGLGIPADVALVGYADEPVASAMTPRLTTVRQNPYDLGARAAAKLLDVLDGRSVERETLLPVDLVVRASCGMGS